MPILPATATIAFLSFAPAPAADIVFMSLSRTTGHSKEALEPATMATEPQENRRPWTTPQIAYLIAEGAEGGVFKNLDEAGHAVSGVTSLTFGVDGSAS